MLEEIKDFLRIDGADDDVRLSLLISDAQAEINHATGAIFNELDDFHKFTLFMMVKLSSGDFDTDPKAKESIEKSIESRLTKIKYCYPEGV